MKGRRLWIGLLVFGTALGTGCPQAASIRILAPAPGEILTWMPVDVRIEVAAVMAIETLGVTLNGVDVTDRFTVGAMSGGFEAVAQDVWAEGLVLAGPNQLVASVQGPGGATVSTSRSFSAEGDPYADAVLLFSPGLFAGFGQANLPGVVLGAPRGTSPTLGSLHVVSLGIGNGVTPAGVIRLEFVDNVIVDGPGVDFTVFENPFFVRSGLTIVGVFSEPGRVSVSEDGADWCTFEACQLDPANAPFHPGCAGVYPVLADSDDPAAPHASIPTQVPIEDWIGTSILTLDVPGSGGDSFDLADLAGCSLGYVRYVEIEAADFVGGPVGADNQGFDLDALAAVHSVPARDDDGNGVPDALE